LKAAVCTRSEAWSIAGVLIVQKVLWELFPHRPVVRKNSFVASAMMVWNPAFSGDETSHQPPGSIEKNRCAPGSNFAGI
jgi:hypothetical protein